MSTTIRASAKSKHACVQNLFWMNAFVVTHR